MEEIKEKKKFSILGFSIWQILAYFIIYSIIGYFIETLFGFFTKGVLESRKSFLYGPFCGIYGVGAVIMIVSLQRFKKNNYTLFIGGFIVGSIVEYVVSLLGELILNVKWWDYSDIFLNLGGRICFTFSLFWGLLAIYLMTHFNPLVDKLIAKIKGKFSKRAGKIIIIVMTIFLLVDCIITGVALKLFYERLVYNFDLDIENAEEYKQAYEESYSNEWIRHIAETYFSDKKMLRTFPNLKITAKNGDIIYVDSLFPDIQPYYIKLFEPKR